ncbi:hypothetical protein ES708_18869 [subsurface metagenome]
MLHNTNIESYITLIITAAIKYSTSMFGKDKTPQPSAFPPTRGK